MTNGKCQCYTGCMYVGVDVGGTKTLIAVFDGHGEIVEWTKFPTPKNYSHFLLELRHTFSNLKNKEFKAGGAGIPVTVFDRRHGIARNFGHLPWKDVHVQHDLEQIFNCPFVVENDAKLAGFSESLLITTAYQKVLYVTVSTGIGISLINDGVIDTGIGDSGGSALFLTHGGKRVAWDSFVSGHAIVERYGKRAADITDEKTWKKISRELAQGLIELIAITEPEVIVIGGSVGTYFERYGDHLATELKRFHLPLVTIPPLRKAQRPEEAVVYGCYNLAHQTFNHNHVAVT